jgi:hypothetical protein
LLLVLFEDVLRSDVGGTDGGFGADGFAEKHWVFPSDCRTSVPT